MLGFNLTKIKGKKITIDGTPFNVTDVVDDMNKSYKISSETIGRTGDIRINFISSKKHIKLTVTLSNRGNSFDVYYLKDHPADEPLSCAGHWDFPNMDWFKWTDFANTVSVVCSPYIKELTHTMNEPYYPDYWGVKGGYY
jgi:hypothetical protein